jgi:16S rRNA A1518/A1519 N6-dimethyltransferase RsmA/KsgA/DIM1 with predicted DNA glycosylase/AP lyase activity
MLISQNFIKSPFLIRQLFSVSNINPNDLVIEIGPGRGIITQQLVNRAQKVITIEKDNNLFKDLILKFKDSSNLKIINGDFLSYKLPDTDYKVFSNIPFDITAEIIDKFLKSSQKPKDIYLIMQQEAAEKYIGKESETQNSILIKPFYDIEILGDIDRTSFTKKPQVNIVFTHFSLKEKFLINPSFNQNFRDFIIYGFNQWQPNILKSFKDIFSFNQFKSLNKRLKINNLKPSELRFNQWLDFFNTYLKFVSPIKKDLVDGFEKKYLNRIRVKKQGKI